MPVQYVPGWDCHGLPIVLKVLQSLDQDARKGLTPIKLRAKAAKFAKATLKAQMASFKRFGVWVDWDHPYLTVDPEYKAAQIELFGQMVFKGYIYRGRKPVNWSPSSRTALAKTELEYEECHISKSIYAIFKILSTPTKGGLLNEFIPKLSLAIVEVQSCSPDIASSSEDKKKRFVALDLVPTLEMGCEACCSSDVVLDLLAQRLSRKLLNSRQDMTFLLIKRMLLKAQTRKC
ncbi:putative isoleucine--tRNA ligase, mitochondrial [Artemisia annua]|uniref:Putative isoleucine--tRNA ligase, mitochondrial n=1 Tax=Artemisia annua TaxID=35608 RepID=A0A2U1LHD4_ARTAN|nr:putative isoleucine--tRNA ligase, mitochondrial [Artemisia annua]